MTSIAREKLVVLLFNKNVFVLQLIYSNSKKAVLLFKLTSPAFSEAKRPAKRRAKIIQSCHVQISPVFGDGNTEIFLSAERSSIELMPIRNRTN